MIDFHTHVLPGVDDGSESLEESLELISMLREQGVTTICATPHFDASRDTPACFLQRRDEAYGRLAEKTTDARAILRGAEVAYYPGISRMSELTDLRLEGTRLLLLEMPMAAWGEYALGELTDLSCSGEITVVLAHVERYMRFQRAAVWERLLDSGILMQANASFFLQPKTRRTALRWLRWGALHLSGSDCHGVETRPPRLGEAMAVIEKKLGRGAVEELNARAARIMLENAR